MIVVVVVENLSKKYEVVVVVVVVVEVVVVIVAVKVVCMYTFVLTVVLFCSLAIHRCHLSPSLKLDRKRVG